MQGFDAKPPRRRAVPRIAGSLFGRGRQRAIRSVRINDQWRICFTWKDDGPYDVEIVGYYSGGSNNEEEWHVAGATGEILNEEFLKPLGMTANALAKAISVPPNRITAILKGERGITGDTAIRLGTFFKTSAEFWMNLQMTYDLRNAEKALPARVRKTSRMTRTTLA